MESGSGNGSAPGKSQPIPLTNNQPAQNGGGKCC